MNAARRTLLVLGLIALASVASGCQSMSNMFYKLQPSQLQQLNRGPGMPTGPEAYS
jgi:hypothetical protein